MKKKNQTSNINKYLLAGLTMVCVLLMFLSVFYVRAAGPFRVLANLTVIPMQQGFNKVGSLLVDVSENLGTLEESRKLNKSLQAKIDELIMENNNLQEEKYELERLRELYKLDQNYAEYEKVGARVISKDPGNWFSTFTIDKGSIDGIRVDMNVIAGSGLVGIVTQVGPTWATVRSIIDDSSNVGGMVLSTSDTCTVRGDLSLINDGKMRFEQMENNDNKVEVGEQIVTSHISDKYLQGILIGYVSEVQVDSNNLTRSGYLTPVVNFKKLQEVLVITKTKADLTGTGAAEEQPAGEAGAPAEDGAGEAAPPENGADAPAEEGAGAQPPENGAGAPPEDGAGETAPPENGAGAPAEDGAGAQPPENGAGAPAEDGAGAQPPDQEAPEEGAAENEPQEP